MKKSLPFIAALFGAAFIFSVFVLFIILIPKNNPPHGKAHVMIIHAPTSTPLLNLTIVPTPTPAEDEIDFSQYKFKLGEFVQIAGTAGDGLSLRSQPGRTYNIKFIGMDSEVFEVVDGPVETDGYTWWYLEAPYDKTRNGWSVDEFLQKVNVP